MMNGKKGKSLKAKNYFSYYIGNYTACLVKGTFFTLILNSKKYDNRKNNSS